MLSLSLFSNYHVQQQNYSTDDSSTDTCDPEDDLEESEFCLVILVCKVTLFILKNGLMVKISNVR